MQNQIAKMIARLDRIEARRAAMTLRFPKWAEAYQGAYMFLVMLADMGARVSQATNPGWFEPAELTTEAVKEKAKLGNAMLAADSYADASVIAQAELGKWPKYRYPPRPQESTEETS
jgi:hypothetical protein